MVMKMDPLFLKAKKTQEIFQKVEEHFQHFEKCLQKGNGLHAAEITLIQDMHATHKQLLEDIEQLTTQQSYQPGLPH